MCVDGISSHVTLVCGREPRPLTLDIVIIPGFTRRERRPETFRVQLRVKTRRDAASVLLKRHT